MPGRERHGRDDDECRRDRRDRRDASARGARCRGEARARAHPVERLKHLARRLRTASRILLEQPRDELRKRGGYVGAQRAQRSGHLRQVRGEELVRRTSREGGAAGEQLVRHAAERVEVGAMVRGGIAGCLLGRHVRRRPDARAELGERAARRLRAGRRERLGNPEVRDDRRITREQNVLRLDVAVHHAALVGVGECARHVPQHAHRFAHGQRGIALEPRTQRETIDEGHRVVGQPFGLARGEQRDDVRLLQARGELDLACEAFGRHSGGEVGGKHLHNDIAVEGDIARDEHPRHSAAAQLARQRAGRAQRGLELVAQTVAREIRHVRERRGGAAGGSDRCRTEGRRTYHRGAATTTGIPRCEVQRSVR
jgi:hypothetical protein